MADNNILTATKSVTATITPLATQNGRRKRLLIFNNNAAAGQVVYVGGEDVTDLIGQPIDPRGSITLVADEGDIGSSEAWYGICAAGQSANVRVLEVLN